MMKPQKEVFVDSGATNAKTSRPRAIEQLDGSRNHGGDACIGADSRLSFHIEHSVGVAAFHVFAIILLHKGSVQKY